MKAELVNLPGVQIDWEVRDAQLLSRALHAVMENLVHFYIWDQNGKIRELYNKLNELVDS